MGSQWGAGLECGFWSCCLPGHGCDHCFVLPLSAGGPTRVLAVSGLHSHAVLALLWGGGGAQGPGDTNYCCSPQGSVKARRLWTQMRTLPRKVRLRFLPWGLPCSLLSLSLLNWIWLPESGCRELGICGKYLTTPCLSGTWHEGTHVQPPGSPWLGEDQWLAQSRLLPRPSLVPTPPPLAWYDPELWMWPHCVGLGDLCSFLLHGEHAAGRSHRPTWCAGILLGALCGALGACHFYSLCSVTDSDLQSSQQNVSRGCKGEVKKIDSPGWVGEEELPGKIRESSQPACWPGPHTQLCCDVTVPEWPNRCTEERVLFVSPESSSWGILLFFNVLLRQSSMLFAEKAEGCTVGLPPARPSSLRPEIPLLMVCHVSFQRHLVQTQARPCMRSFPFS